MGIQNAIKRMINAIGLDITHLRNCPAFTLAGIRGRNIRTILDIGANKGQSAVEYRRLFPEANIYCFEPLPDVYAELESWAKLQDGKVKTFNLAISDNSGSATIHRHVDHSPSSSLLPTTSLETKLYPQTQKQTEVNISLTRLDDVAADIQLVPELLVKIDVQGHEAAVLRGGRKVLSSATCCILEASVQPLYEGQAKFEELVASLAELDFAYIGNVNQHYDANGYVIFLDAAFIKRSEIEAYVRAK